MQDFPSSNISPFDSKNDVPINPRTGKPKMVGHYTQLVWADTYKIGCGFIMFHMKEGYKKVNKYDDVFLQTLQFRKFEVILTGSFFMFFRY